MSKQQNAKNVNENAKEIVAMKNVVCNDTQYPNDLDSLQAQSLIFTHFRVPPKNNTNVKISIYITFIFRFNLKKKITFKTKLKSSPRILNEFDVVNNTEFLTK